MAEAQQAGAVSSRPSGLEGPDLGPQRTQQASKMPFSGACLPPRETLDAKSKILQVASSCNDIPLEPRRDKRLGATNFFP